MHGIYYFIKNIPLVRILSIFTLGVILGIYFQNTYTVLIAFVLSLISVSLSMLLRRNYSLAKLEKQISRISFLFYVSLFLSAYVLSVLHNQSLYKSHFSKHVIKNSVAELVLTDTPIEKENSYKIHAKVNSVHHENKSIYTQGKIIAYIEKSEQAAQLNFGDVLLCRLNSKEIDEPKNPFEFNYKDYLKFHNVYHTSYISNENWVKTSIEGGHLILKKIALFRNYLHRVIGVHIDGEKEKSIANAILIGKKDLLDKDTIRAYSSSGAMHVLAVSGLHVGIIYIVFNYLFFFVNIKKLPFLKPIILVVLIWGYAFVTGASPSVLRAATMFSFIAIGSSLKQQINIYNTLAASALLLILINPYIITEVGFQLSYLAVIGIIALQKKIYNLIYIKNFIVDKIWMITTVSLSAQIATFPLGLLYFHQFPNLFWISNLFVIPIAFIIVYMGVALFVFSPIPYIADFIGVVLSKIIYFLNLMVSKIDQLPYALSSGLHISLIDTYLIYAIIILLTIALAYKQKTAFKFSLLFMLMFSISYSYEIYKATTQHTLTVYSVPKHSAIELYDGRNRYTYTDNVLKENESQLLFRLKHNWWGTYTKNQDFMSVSDSIQLLEFNNKTILLVDSNYALPAKRLEVDYCILKHQKKIYMYNFTAKIKADKYIFDSSNKSYYIKYWKKDCDSLNLDCYFVQNQNALVENIPSL